MKKSNDKLSTGSSDMPSSPLTSPAAQRKSASPQKKEKGFFAPIVPLPSIGVQRIKKPGVRGEGGPPPTRTRVWEIRGFFADMSELGFFTLALGIVGFYSVLTMIGSTSSESVYGEMFGNLFLTVLFSVIISYILIYVFQNIRGHVKLFLLIAILLLLYSVKTGGKYKLYIYSNLSSIYKLLCISE